MQDRHEPVIERHRLGIAAVAHEAEQRLALAREDVGHARHPADGAERDAFQHHVVEAAEGDEAVARHVAHIDDAARVAGRILEGDDRVDIGEAGQHGRRHVRAVARRVVVDHDRRVGGARDRREMIERLARLRRIDHGRHHHEPVDADAGRLAGIGRTERAGIFGKARDHRHAAPRRGGRHLDQRDLFGLRQRAVLADRAADDEAGDAVGDQRLDHLGRRVEIDGEIRAELGGHRRKNTLPALSRIHRRSSSGLIASCRQFVFIPSAAVRQASGARSRHEKTRRAQAPAGRSQGR